MLYPAQAVDGLVHLQGGAPLREALIAAAPVLEERKHGEHLRCQVGQAVLTSGPAGACSSGPSGLPFDAIVHTVPPFWPRGADQRDPEARSEWERALLGCYAESFRAALSFYSSHRKTVGDSSNSAATGLAIATPVLGTGARGAPFAPAAQVLAAAAVEHFSAENSATDVAATTLRVVVHDASLNSELTAVKRALREAATAVGVATEAYR